MYFPFVAVRNLAIGLMVALTVWGHPKALAQGISVTIGVTPSCPYGLSA
jgi:hypothetical protein